MNGLEISELVEPGFSPGSSAGPTLRMPTARFGIIGGVSSALAQSAGAQVVLHLPKDHAAAVPVWKNEAAMTDGLALIRSGAVTEQPTLLIPLLACFPDGGTRAVVVDRAMFTRTVRVIEGRWTGCRGIVPREWLAVTK